MNKVTLDFARKHIQYLTGRIIDVGSLNENGEMRSVLPIDVGVDMRPGKGVDNVCSCEDLISIYGEGSFDTVVSSDMLEHASNWKACLNNMWGILKDEHYLLLTMARTSKGRHAYPDDYWRFPLADFKSLFDGNKVIASFDQHPSIGVIVQKNIPVLDLSIDAIKVP